MGNYSKGKCCELFSLVQNIIYFNQNIDTLNQIKYYILQKLSSYINKGQI